MESVKETVSDRPLSIRYDSIQMLRGIAALYVVGYHFRPMLNNSYAGLSLGDIFFGSGFSGVDLFFMISGL